VDPAQRYTIDEFLAHPWCNAAPAPPPPHTPNVYSNLPTANLPLDSPLLSAARGGRPEGRSPGIAVLKEAFDVTYAVHRMEEEGARRRKYNGRGGAGVRGFLNGLNEDDEDDEEEDSVPARNTRAAPPTAKQAPAQETASSRTRRSGQKGFELDMDGATLLGRRHKRGVGGRGAVGMSSPLSGKPLGSPMVEDHDLINPGSPMRIS
jgi:serine/threonine-protein kinase RCK2